MATETVDVGGSVTLAGALSSIPTFGVGLSGEFESSGGITLRNPAWILIDKKMKWMGEWDATWSYDVDDVVLYKRSDGVEWHVFVSKTGHNVGNTPTSSAAAWRRLYQEPLL